MFEKNSQSSGIGNFIIKLVILCFFILIGLFIYNILNILILLCFALFLNILFSPFLNTFNKIKISDGIGMILIYIGILIFIGLTFFSIVPIFVNQISILIEITSQFINESLIIYNTKGLDGFAIPEFIKGFLINIDISEILKSIQANIGQISSFVSENLKSFLTSGAGIIFSITNVMFNVVLLFIFTFFIALERNQIRRFFYNILPEKTSLFLQEKEPKIVQTLYNWLKSQLILAISIFFITLISLGILKIFGVEITEIFTLALIAGMMEFIPYIGPFLALLPALAIALGVSMKTTLIILILYLIIQQIENNVLVPYVMGKTLSLSPFAVLIAMVIGGSLFGVIGIIISVPFVAIIQLFLQDYLEKNKNSLPKEIKKIGGKK